MTDTKVSPQITFINPEAGRDSTYSNEVIVNFLHQHLDEFGDNKLDIAKCLKYVFDKGGFMLVASLEGAIVGAVVVNDTGMEGYIPEHILVYIAVHNNHRGIGLGKLLMQQAIDKAPGNIALHVEPDNPAVHLYKKLGFTNKYLEMRLNK